MTDGGRNQVTIRNLIYRGFDACVKCARPVAQADAVLTLIDLKGPKVIANQRLRHKWCGVSKYRPVHSPNRLLEMIEFMMADPTKLCPVCNTGWTDTDDLDALVFAEYRGVQKVLHATCL